MNSGISRQQDEVDTTHRSAGGDRRDRAGKRQRVHERTAGDAGDLSRRLVLARRQGGRFRASSGGIVVIDRVLGKHEYIKYAVGITAAGTVKRIEILEYNESYGYEVREASWRSQFVGKSASSPLQLNVDIKNISGATLSAKHITDGVRRLVGQFQSLKGQ